MTIDDRGFGTEDGDHKEWILNIINIIKCK